MGERIVRAVHPGFTGQKAGDSEAELPELDFLMVPTNNEERLGDFAKREA
jgi:hypothetical protein